VSHQSNQPITLSTKAALEELLESEDRVLVEFHTQGCGKCEAMKPVLDAVARKRDAAVVTMNPRDDPALVSEYDVRSVPKLLLFVDGRLVDSREDGLLSVEETLSFVDTEGTAVESKPE